MRDTLASLYFGATLQYPFVVWVALALFFGFSAYFGQDFRLDASADSLVLENDADLRSYREIRELYGSDDFLVVTYTPQGSLFGAESLDDLRALRDELLGLERVRSVTSILDVPLIASPRVSLAEIRKEVRTLENPDVDRTLAQQEFRQSPLYRNLLVGSNGRTTAVLITFQRDPHYHALLNRREALREQQLQHKLNPTQRAELASLSRDFKRYSTRVQDATQTDIAAIREILDRYRSQAKIHLGGVPMIASDMIDFIRNDIRTFGIGVLCMLISLLSIAFKRPRWVLVPMLICAAAAIGMVGYLGLVEWRVTVVSSNFISLLLIITLSLTVHLVVRYEELHAAYPGCNQRELIKATIDSKVAPSFYTALTTMVAFASLVVSDIRPVIDFGWMMVFGVGLAFLCAFLLFPAALIGLPARAPALRTRDTTAAIARFFARLIQRFSNTSLAVFLIIGVFSSIGIMRLTVENRFIDYFKESTEIHQGMLLIDRELGGTTPLDVVLHPNMAFVQTLAENTAAHNQQEPREEAAEEDDFTDDWMMDDNQTEAGITGDSYWFNIFELSKVEQIHQYLDNLPETGKVLSLATTMRILRQLNDGRPLDSFILAVMYKRLPEEVKRNLFEPYMAPDGNQIRFSIRVIDSDANLQRDALLEKIQRDLVSEFGLEEQQVKLSGMLVLYNNVLQSLFRSQLLTVGFVFLAILLVFLLLFRSLKLALIGVAPTVSAACLILGLMGWLGIPLDIMTITVAAVTIGIGVDDTIHYIHRYKVEIAKDGDNWAAVRRCHGSVGRAIYYTSVIITLGFSILVFSNFIPTIYFGILAGIAMVIALVANLTLLPLLLVRFGHLGRPT